MRLGVFSVFDSYPETDPGRATRRPEDALRLLRAAEHFGFDAFWVGEHHFRASGSLPSPPVWLAAAARETRRIRLGALVSVLPLHGARELAEQYALVDRLCGGRLEVGLGTGYDPSEFAEFGLSFPDRRDRFDTSLPEFQRALSGEDLPSQSEGGPPVTLNVRPIQRPHPPIWVAAARTAGIRSVAEKGLGLALIPYATLGHIDELGERVEIYLRHLRPGAEPRILVGFHVYAAGDSDVPRRPLQRFLDSRPTPPFLTYLEHRRQHPDLRTSEGLERSGLVLFTSGAELRRRVAALESVGVTDLAGIFDFGDLRWADVAASLRGFMNSVRPNANRGSGESDAIGASGTGPSPITESIRWAGAAARRAKG